jgi:hypothetical protein
MPCASAAIDRGQLHYTRLHAQNVAAILLVRAITRLF